MGRTTFLAALFVGLTAGAASAQEKPRDVMPQGVPPRIFSGASIDLERGDLVLMETVVRFVWESVVKQVEQEGKVKEVKVIVRKPVYETRSHVIPLATAEVFDGAGNKLSHEEVAKRFVSGMTVVVSADGQPVDAAYLSVLAKDALVFVSAEFAANVSNDAIAPVPVYAPPLVAPPLTRALVGDANGFHDPVVLPTVAERVVTPDSYTPVPAPAGTPAVPAYPAPGR